MENLIRLLMRFLLVPLGYLAASIAGTLVVLVASWRLVDMALGGHPDGPAFAFLGFAIGGPILLIFVLVFMLLPASIGILISEAFAIRSWIFHVLNGVASAWLGWQLYGSFADNKSISRSTSRWWWSPPASRADLPIGRWRASARASTSPFSAAVRRRLCPQQPGSRPSMIAVNSRGSVRH